MISLIASLSARGVELYLDGEELRYRAPEGAFTSDLRSQVRARRAELVAALQRGSAMVCEDCGKQGTVMVEMHGGWFLCRRCWTIPQQTVPVVVLERDRPAAAQDDMFERRV